MRFSLHKSTKRALVVIAAIAILIPQNSFAEISITTNIYIVHRQVPEPLWDRKASMPIT